MTEANLPGKANDTDKMIYRITMGIVVILVGLLFLAREQGYNLDFLWLKNWWALFILIPAVAMYARVLARIRRTGRFDADAAGTLIGALSTTLVAVLFLLDLGFGKWWPVFVILGGVAILLSGFSRDTEP